MLINTTFLRNKSACITQTVIAFVFIVVVLCALDGLSNTIIFRVIGATSLSASTFIVFATSSSSTARSRSILGGYIVAALVGLFFYLLARLIDWYLFKGTYFHMYEICGALALASSLLLMIAFDMPHPPAAGFSVGIVIDAWDPVSLLVIAVAVIALLILKRLLRHKLISFV